LPTIAHLNRRGLGGVAAAAPDEVVIYRGEALTNVAARPGRHAPAADDEHQAADREITVMAPRLTRHRVRNG
jgi:hypothetical protein